MKELDLYQLCHCWKRKKMDGSVGKFADAISCLRQTLKEGRKAKSVDIRQMLFNVHKCENLVEELQNNKDNIIYKTALTSLLGSLSANAAVLNRKISQLNTASDKGHAENDKVLDDKQASFLGHNNVQTAQSQTPLPKTPIPSMTRSGNSNFAQTPESSSTCYSGTDHDEPMSPYDCTDKHGQARRNVIQSTISRPSDVTFDHVVGLDAAKQALHEAVITPLLFPHLFSVLHSWRRILLYGPPGTGKSRLAQAVSAEVRATFYSVSSTDLMSSWVGETEKLIKELFQHARNQPGQSVIFIDEIDSLCRKRNSREDESTRRIKTELLIQMDGRDQPDQNKIFLLCATNCPFDLDTAFLRRFQKRIYIPLPDMSSRLKLLHLHCGSHHVAVDQAEWSELAAHTEGYSGSDLATLVMAALMIPISELQQAVYWTNDSNDHWLPCDKDDPNAVMAKAEDLPTDKIRPRAACMSDFLQSLSCHRATVCDTELKRIEDFTSNFGQTA